jgi:hypothetical protein
MRLSSDELALLNAACADRANVRAQELLNVLGTSSAEEIIRQIVLLPKEMQADIEVHLREAINEQKRRVRPR